MNNHLQSWPSTNRTCLAQCTRRARIATNCSKLIEPGLAVRSQTFDNLVDQKSSTGFQPTFAFAIDFYVAIAADVCVPFIFQSSIALGPALVIVAMISCTPLSAVLVGRLRYFRADMFAVSSEFRENQQNQIQQETEQRKRALSVAHLVANLAHFALWNSKQTFLGSSERVDPVRTSEFSNFENSER